MERTKNHGGSLVEETGQSRVANPSNLHLYDIAMIAGDPILYIIIYCTYLYIPLHLYNSSLNSTKYPVFWSSRSSPFLSKSVSRQSNSTWLQLAGLRSTHTCRPGRHQCLMIWFNLVQDLDMFNVWNITGPFFGPFSSVFFSVPMWLNDHDCQPDNLTKEGETSECAAWIAVSATIEVAK